MSALGADMDRLVTELVTKGVRLQDAQSELERRFIEQVLERHDGNLGRAAEDLGLHRNTLSRKVAAFKKRRR